MEPGKKIQYNGSQVVLPDIKMMVFSGCNPWNHHQDRNRMKEAFRKLQTVVNIDYTWTPTCRFSDIVLPACTQFERNDIDQFGTYSTAGVLAMHKLVDPLFQSKTDFQIFTELCERFGKSKEYTRGMTEMEWVKQLYNDCRAANKDKYPIPEFNEFWQQGLALFKTNQSMVSHAAFREILKLIHWERHQGLLKYTAEKSLVINTHIVRGTRCGLRKMTFSWWAKIR